MSDPAARPWWLRRHHLIWTLPEWHASAVTQIADAELHRTVASLLAAGLPSVVCRQTGTDRTGPAFVGSIACGLSLPPELGKRRLAFAIPRKAIVRAAPPLALAEVIPHLPSECRAPSRRLLRAAELHGAELRVYGSAAWQSLTGRRWLTAQSDVDFLWRARDSAQIAEVVALLGEWERESGRRADGEILFGEDDAVAWREWLPAAGQSPTQRVVVKNLHGPRLSAREALLAALPRNRISAVACA